MKKLILMLALLVPAAACASARAQVQPEEHPALEVPPVPPRHIEPLPVEPPEIELVADLPSSTPANPPRPRPNAPEPNNRSTDPKGEAKPDTPTDPAATPPVTPPVPPLRQGTVDGPELERQVRDTLERAGKMLDKVNPGSLNDERRANYEYAKSFMKQSEDEIKAKNLTSAKSLADRAETIAKLLAGG
jgi:hypothetical protein